MRSHLAMAGSLPSGTVVIFNIDSFQVFLEVGTPSKHAV